MNNNITSKDNNITTTHSYLNYLTLLSIISSFAVVSLHTNGIFWQFSAERYWFTANIIESIYYFAVPIFFMISGVNLLDYSKRYNTQQFFLKRINKTFIPFIFWSFVGLIFRVSFIKDIPIDQISLAVQPVRREHVSTKSIWESLSTYEMSLSYTVKNLVIGN